MKSEGTCAYYVFSDFVSFAPKLYVYNFIYMTLYPLQAGLFQKCENKNVDLQLFINDKQ